MQCMVRRQEPCAGLEKLIYINRRHLQLYFASPSCKAVGLAFQGCWPNHDPPAQSGPVRSSTVHHLSVLGRVTYLPSRDKTATWVTGPIRPPA